METEGHPQSHSELKVSFSHKNLFQQQNKNKTNQNAPNQCEPNTQTQDPESESILFNLWEYDLKMIPLQKGEFKKLPRAGEVA